MLFIREQLQIIINKGILKEVLVSNIHPLMLDERIVIVEEKIEQILQN